MEQKRVVVVLEQPHLHVGVGKLHHIVKVTAECGVLLHEKMPALAHEEQREVIIVALRLVNISLDGLESLMVYYIF